MQTGVKEKRAGGGEPGALALYLAELRRIPLQGEDEEKECARMAARGDENARRRLVQANLRFVVSVARGFASRGVPLEDLVNEGNVGLLKAAARFDPERGVRFVSYASCWVRHAVLEAVRAHGSLVRGALVTLSLDQAAAGAEDSEPLAARLEDRGAARPEDALAGAAVREHVGALLAGLSEREAGIVRQRFGFGGTAPATLREAGSAHGLSRERVRQIEKRALRRIRASGGALRLAACAS